MKVGFQGIHGAYSESAAFTYLGNGISTTGFETFADLIEALNQQQIDAAFLPVENSIVGSIAENIDLLIREDLSIIAEVFLAIRHHLLGCKGSSLSRVKEALSHPAALSQCKDFLRMNSIKPVPEYDTAGSAKLVGNLGSQSKAAIASSLCAELYGLDVLAKDIQSFKNNLTRFFVVVRKQDAPKDLHREKTSIVFKTYHRPGALVEILSILSKHSINMTKLESRPIPENPWQYSFLVDIEGGIFDEPVLKAIAEIGAATPFHKVLGSYPKGGMEAG